MSSTTADSRSAGEPDVKRGPNEEAVETAQDNVTTGYGSSGKASIMSGKPDGDTGAGPGVNNEQGQAAPDRRG